MYVMCAGTALTDTHPVWHVAAKNDTRTLCGQPVPAPGQEHTTERHCPECMANFRETMQVRTA
ncbi:hypothetical protein [Streptomyces sp. NPDC086023]|uniref:hypothetical protein n=1 Tax=Streptomyces sp. NPDC086023 TaxID=3365746 RepID=UPI0037D2C7A8